MLSIVVATAVFAGPTKSPESGKIENPQTELLAKEAELLKRVVRIANASGEVCTGTWLEDGIIVTADHCFPLVDDKMKVLINGVETRLVHRIKFTNHPDDRVQKLLMPFGHSLPVAVLNARDVMVWLVDRAPLEQLKLPKTPFPVAAPQSESISPGTEVLIAGYGLDSLLGGKAGTLGAALVKTVKPDSNQPYTMMIRAQRSVVQSTLCLFGDLIQFCRRRVQFYAANDQNEASILQGDSGGPAFRKNAKGQWELLGVASTIGRLMSGTIDRKMTYSMPPLSDRATEEIEIPKDETKTDTSVRKNLIERESSLVKSLGMDPKQPLPTNLSILQSLKGEVDDFHVNLSDPKLHVEVSNGLQTLRDLRDGKVAGKTGQTNSGLSK